MSGGLDIGVAKKIDGLFVALDEFNGNIMIDFRAAYVAFQSDPCGSGQFLHRSIERISDRRNQMITLKMQILALVELAKTNPNSDAFSNIFGDIVRRLKPEGAGAVQITVSELREAETEAKCLSGEIQ
ncbi:hypothetical protein [Mesorhizobium sp. M0091]|uniref:hypothetical protein n=1 Tax=Mesorhizobium sp. M0091 TaxID=2956875 RepID=UPI0033386B9D